MKPDLSLYLIADTEVPTQHPFLQIIEEAIQGGITAVQLRSKKKNHDEFLEIASLVRNLTTRYQTPFFINDDVHVARLVNADGVHLGQNDVVIEDAKNIIGFQRTIGLSTHTLEEAQDAERRGADYIGVGTVYPTTSKDDIRGVIGTTGLMKIRKGTKLQIVGIGGIDLANAASVLDAGADGIAIISAIMKSDFPQKVAREFKAIIDRHKSRGSI